MFGHPHHDHRRRNGSSAAGERWAVFLDELDARFDTGFNAARSGGGGGRRRVFAGDELRLVLLALIAETPRHGYDLIREIETRTGGAYAPSPGVVYPTVTLLADMDLIAERPSTDAKKVYAITPAGEAHLAERADEAAALMARLGAMGERRERSSRGPVKRAMGNLRQVLQHRLHGEEAASETLHSIADILDEAARKIERLA